jgi:hypothetical protein
VLLARFKQAQVSVGFRTGRMSFQVRAPRGLSVNIVALLLERERCLPLLIGRDCLLANAKRGGDGEDDGTYQAGSRLH